MRSLGPASDQPSVPEPTFAERARTLVYLGRLDLQDSVSTSLVRYRGGITTYLEVVDGQRSLFNAELTLAQARGNEYQSLAQLYKALGGGWQ
jgi:Outer membrane efflux protein